MAPPFAHEEVLRRVSYDPETGVFIRREYADTKGRINIRYAGKEAGCVWRDQQGRAYRQITICGVKTYAHRLAWFYMTGEWVDLVDHQNLDGLDNRWENLRPASKSENGTNCRARRNNTTGLKGVGFDKRRQRYRAQIKYGGRNHFLGYFATAEEAHEAYRAASLANHGAFARAA